jgi:hypothetical protein
LDALPSGSVKAAIGKFADNGFLTLGNVATYSGTIKADHLSGFHTYHLNETGHSTDTLATLYDVRAAGGGGGSTPTLQDVLNSGSTLTNDADISNGSGTNYLSASNWAGINFQTSDEPTDGTSSYFNFDQYGIDLQHRLFGSSDSRLVINNLNGVRLYNNLGTDGAEIIINNNVIKLRGYEGVSTLTTLEFGSSTQNLHLFLLGIPTYADESAATTGGLATGTVYKTSTGELRIKL